MNFEISPDRRILTITIDPEDQAYLKTQQQEDERFDSDSYMCDVFESLIANSELDWVDPGDTGDLTSAPMLGIFSNKISVRKLGPYGARHVGHWDGKTRYEPILERWAFMDYQIASPQARLAEYGKVEFVS